MEKKYQKIEFYAGQTIKDCVLELMKRAVKGEFVYANFNGHKLYSDTVSMDSAYLEITGLTYYEKLQKEEEYRAEALRREEEHKNNIPNLVQKWITEGHKVLTEDKWLQWDECVPIRLGDLYHGMELGQCLDIVKELNNNEFQKAKELMENQGHSGMSWGLIKSMVRVFSDRGAEFILFIGE